MDSSDDSNKQASTLHEPTAATQPLLSKPYPTLEPPIASTSAAEDDQTAYLQISYNYGPRSLKDLPFLILFCLLVLSTLGFGIFASVNRNPHRSQVSSFFYNASSSSCSFLKVRSPFPSNYSNWSENSNSSEIPASLNSSKSSVLDVVHANISFPTRPTSFYYSKSGISLIESENSSFSEKPVSLNSPRSTLLNGLIDYSSYLGNFGSLNSRESSIVKSLIWTLVITLILSVPFVFSVLLLLKHFTKQIVYTSLPFFVIVPIFFNVYWFVACIMSSKCSYAFPLAYRIVVLIFVFLIIGVIVWIFIINWHRIELTVRIIAVSSNALSRNLGLFGVLPALTLGLFMFYVPIVLFLIFTNSNGKIMPKEEHGEYVCVWKRDNWVPAYYTLAILTMLWCATAMVEAQVYVISGTIAQWYFSKNDAGPKHGIRSSLRNAFGPSSGTICFSGLLICVVRIVRSVVDSGRQEDASGIVNLILRCCANAVLRSVDFLNKFTINFAAITGEAYCSAAMMTYELLKRNLLSTVIVETVSTRILSGIILVLSAIYAILVSFLTPGIHYKSIYAFISSLFAIILSFMKYAIVMNYKLPPTIIQHNARRLIRLLQPCSCQKIYKFIRLYAGYESSANAL